MAELADHHPADALYAALLTALLDAAARLDTDASRVDTWPRTDDRSPLARGARTALP
jgi:hypothetical protein